MSVFRYEWLGSLFHIEGEMYSNYGIEEITNVCVHLYVLVLLYITQNKCKTAILIIVYHWGLN